MPVVDVHMHGDLTTPGSMRQDDLKILSSARAQAKMVRLLAKTPLPINLHFANLPEKLNTDRHFASQHIGYQTSDAIEQQFEIKVPVEHSALTVVLVENEGDDRLPLTPWMIAHRISHALIIRCLSRDDILKGLYDHSESTMQKIAILYGKEYHITPLTHVFGTSRSSRLARIRRFGEWHHECFAQVCVTGRVAFQPAASQYDPGFVLKAGTTPEDVDRQLNEFASRFTATVECYLRSKVGQIVLL